MSIPKWADCVKANKHSSFQRCHDCVEVHELVGPIYHGGTFGTDIIYRTAGQGDGVKVTKESVEFFRLNKDVVMSGVVEKAISDVSLYCMGCAKGEKWVWPPKSSIVGQAAVHSSGMICIPNTIRMLLKEKQ